MVSDKQSFLLCIPVCKGLEMLHYILVLRLIIFTKAETKKVSFFKPLSSMDTFLLEYGNRMTQKFLLKTDVIKTGADIQMPVHEFFLK